MANQTLSPFLSAEERLKALDYLTQTRDDLLEAVSDLTDSQWRFKAAAGQWSIAEILEHLVIVEGRAQAIVERMPEAPEAEPDRNNVEVEKILLAEVPRRPPKYQAPEQILPRQERTPEEYLRSFLEGRVATIELLDVAPALRGHLVPHPILGPWDGYQWILAMAGHTARHIGQIQEVKADALFPEMQPVSPFSLP